MRPDEEEAIDELARALASQHPSWTDLQDEAKRTLKRAHPHLGEAALAREHLIINQLRENQPHARDMVSAWLAFALRKGPRATAAGARSTLRAGQVYILARARLLAE